MRHCAPSRYIAISQDVKRNPGTLPPILRLPIAYHRRGSHATREVGALSNFRDLAAIPLTDIWTGVVARTIEEAGVTLAVLELGPNTDVPLHHHPNVQVGILVRGHLRFTIGDETREFGPGGTWTIPGGVPHGVAIGPEGAVVIEAFAPARDDWRQRPVLEPRAPIWAGERE